MRLRVSAREMNGSIDKASSIYDLTMPSRFTKADLTSSGQAMKVTMDLSVEREKVFGSASESAVDMMRRLVAAHGYASVSCPLF